MIPGPPVTAPLRLLLTESGESGRSVRYLVADRTTRASPAIGDCLGPALRLVAALGDATHELLESVDAPVRLAPGGRHRFDGTAQAGPGALGHLTAKRLRSRPPVSARGASAPRVSKIHDRDAHRVRLIVPVSPQDGPR